MEHEPSLWLVDVKFGTLLGPEKTPVRVSLMGCSWPWLPNAFPACVWVGVVVVGWGWGVVVC